MKSIYCFLRVTFIILFLFGLGANGAIISVTPSTPNAWLVIQNAVGGDTVNISPGVYSFLVYITTVAPSNNPVTIQALDPLNPPIWNLTSYPNINTAPGSYTAGDRGRGCWQFSGASNIILQNIVITGCRVSTSPGAGAGIRYYAGSSGIILKGVKLIYNDNGLTGGTENSQIIVTNSHIAYNGNLLASSPSHNIYIYGGNFTLRYSYVHDPIQAQNFHIRSVYGLIEYNWFARPKSYAGDLMTSDDYSNNNAGGPQYLTLRGNLIDQGSPANTGQIFAVFNDALSGNTAMQFHVTLISNTFYVTQSKGIAVHLSNADNTPMTAILVNNIISGGASPYLIENAAVAQIAGYNNWIANTISATSYPLLSNTLTGDPATLFTSSANRQFTLSSGSTAIGGGVSLTHLDSITLPTIDKGLPTMEYAGQGENNICQSVTRLTVNDVGAFESTTTTPSSGPVTSSPSNNPNPTPASTTPGPTGNSVTTNGPTGSTSPITTSHSANDAFRTYPFGSFFTFYTTSAACILMLMIVLQ